MNSILTYLNLQLALRHEKLFIGPFTRTNNELSGVPGSILQPETYLYGLQCVYLVSLSVIFGLCVSMATAILELHSAGL